MSCIRSVCLAVSLVSSACASVAAPRPCITPSEAADHAEKDVCVAAHIYGVVESPDGTRYLDVCKPETPDEQCRFSIISLGVDKKEVGDLAAYREQDIHIRGTVHVMHGQTVILLSNARQFKDGPEKFRPNPALLAGFGADSDKAAFRDPALTAGKHRSKSAFKTAGAY